MSGHMLFRGRGKYIEVEPDMMGFDTWVINRGRMKSRIESSSNDFG